MALMKKKKKKEKEGEKRERERERERGREKSMSSTARHGCQDKVEKGHLDALHKVRTSRSAQLGSGHMVQP